MFDTDNLWESDQKQDLLNEKLFGGVENNHNIVEIKNINAKDKKKKKRKSKAKDDQAVFAVHQKKKKEEIIDNDDKISIEPDIAVKQKKKKVRKIDNDDKISTEPERAVKQKKKEVQKIDNDDKMPVEPKMVVKQKKKKEGIQDNDDKMYVEPEMVVKQRKQKKVQKIDNNDHNMLSNEVDRENKSNDFKVSTKNKKNIELNMTLPVSDNINKNIKKEISNIPANETAIDSVSILNVLNQDKTSVSAEELVEQDVKVHINNESKLPTLNNNFKYNKFQRKLTQKLEGGQFRWLNEKLYTIESKEAFRMFEREPDLFNVYHKGFESQVKCWPDNPVDLIIQDIMQRDSALVVADFGCGDAKISQSVPNLTHSFDLVAVNTCVTACDMKQVPLSNNVIDIAVFCLSLMGTNIVDFVVEARRVLKLNGLLKVAEVKSRFDNLKQFIKNIESLGFSLIDQNKSNKMFVMLDFEKISDSSSSNVNILMNPCIYKRR